MFRAYILLGFTILIALHISGNITKYINMKYAYLSTTAKNYFRFLNDYTNYRRFPKRAPKGKREK